MECAANYELKTDCSIVADDLVLRIDHPKRQRGRAPVGDPIGVIPGPHWAKLAAGSRIRTAISSRASGEREMEILRRMERRHSLKAPSHDMLIVGGRSTEV